MTRRNVFWLGLVLVSGCEVAAHQQLETNTLECVGYCKLKLDQRTNELVGAGTLTLEDEDEVDSDSSVD